MHAVRLVDCTFASKPLHWLSLYLEVAQSNCYHLVSIYTASIIPKLLTLIMDSINAIMHNNIIINTGMTVSFNSYLYALMH